jgi:hypothetical protein
VHDHLLASAAAHCGDGLDEGAATAHALTDFGEARTVAATFRPVVAHMHSGRLAWRLLRGSLLLVSCGLGGYLLLGLWGGGFPDHTRADPTGVTAGVTAARLLVGLTLVTFAVTYTQRFWTGTRLAHWLLGLCVSAEWLITLAWLACPAIVAARLALVLGLPASPWWSAAAALLGGTAAYRLTQPLVGTRLLLAARR